MADFSWMSQREELSNAALTVRAQTVSLNDTGRLLWDQFFPRENVDSTSLQEITTIDFRPAADRREWNQRGRAIPLKLPSIMNLEMTPIEAYFKVGEYEIQKLEERTLGNQTLFMQIVGADIPMRTTKLVEADYRRLELEFASVWANGTITAKNPQNGLTSTWDLEFPSASDRYETAGTAWNHSSVKAYDLLLEFLARSADLIGPIEGVALRQTHFNAIQADAPNPFGNTSPRLTRGDLEARVQDELSSAFRFFVIENTVDVFTDGGTATTRSKIWPSTKVAAIPAGFQVGTTKFAPVARAMEIARNVPGAGVDIRGVTVYSEAENGGRALTVEAQLNAVPIPNEQRVHVVDVGF